MKRLDPGLLSRTITNNTILVIGGTGKTGKRVAAILHTWAAVTGGWTPQAVRG